MRRKWLTEEIELLKKLYSDSSPSQLESILGRNYLAISQQAKRLGLLKSEEYQISRLNQMRIKGANVKFTKAESKVSNHQCFASMNSSSAYWLGFLAADGFIENKSNRVVLNIGKKDRSFAVFQSFCWRNRGNYREKVWDYDVQLFKSPNTYKSCEFWGGSK